MKIKKILIGFLLMLTINQISYADNQCSKWLPMPALDGLVVVLPIYNENITEPDLDCDGIIDAQDNDIDGDGVINSADAFPMDPNESLDTDNDGIGNHADMDDDNDGYSDISELAAGSDPLDANSTPLTIPTKRIFILGSSTVHTANYLSGSDDPHGANRKLEGWGEHLKYYMKDPDKVYNRARSGADSITYRNPDPDRGNLPGYKDRYWGFTENLINATNDNNGGFLLIQFGANDAHHQIGADVFQDQLRAYIADARRLGLIPVLISPPNHRNHINSRPYAQYIEPVADSEDVLFLDLHQKSMDVWANYDIDDYGGYEVEDRSGYQRLPQADILYGYLEYHGAINNTHFSPTGADIVAGWVKDLACQSQRDDAKLLCSQFLTQKNTPNEVPPVIALVGKAEVNVNLNAEYHDKGATASDDIDGDISANVVTSGNVDIHTPGTYMLTYTVSDSSGNEVNTTRTVHVLDPDADIVTVHEDAEDGDTVGWSVYAGSGSITNVADHGGRAIKLEGNNGLNSGFKYPNFRSTTGFVASWSLKYAEPFRLFVLIRSTNSPDANIYMEYTPDDISTGLDGVYIRNGLGSDAMDGSWHTFTRDIEADFHVIYPNENVTEIVGFAIRGSGLVDDLSTSTRAPRETFTYHGHTYKIVKTARTWQNASAAAHADGGYLANIGSIAENHEIYSRLYRYIAKTDYASTVASNGGGASYVWIGGNDIDTEGTWVWEDNSQTFWSGGVGGAPVNGRYSNWGRDTGEVQHEPDNAGNQDAAAIALTEWQLGSGNLGQASQWNDLKVADTLFYVVEYN